MKKFVCVNWFGKTPRTGGELVFSIISDAISEACDLQVKYIYDEMHSTTLNSKVPSYIKLLFETIRSTYKRNIFSQKLVKSDFEVYNDSLSGTFIYIQPRPKSPELSVNLFLFYKSVIDFLLRGGRSNVKVAIYASNFAKSNYRVRKAEIEKVIYPPFLNNELHSAPKKENLVVTLSRIDPSKNLKVLGKVSNVTNIKFVLIGYLEERNKAYLKKLRDKFPNLLIIPNATEEIKNSYLNKAKVYLHTGLGEAFPISKLEAMSFGVIPLVPFSGGAKEGLPDKCVYLNYDDLIFKLKKLIESYTVEDFDYFRNLSSIYTIERFKEQIKQLFIDKI